MPGDADAMSVSAGNRISTGRLFHLRHSQPHPDHVHMPGDADAMSVSAGNRISTGQLLYLRQS
jgi:hypothetical protein